MPPAVRVCTFGVQSCWSSSQPVRNERFHSKDAQVKSQAMGPSTPAAEKKPNIRMCVQVWTVDNLHNDECHLPEEARKHSLEPRSRGILPGRMCFRSSAVYQPRYLFRIFLLVTFQLRQPCISAVRHRGHPPPGPRSLAWAGTHYMHVCGVFAFSQGIPAGRGGEEDLSPSNPTPEPRRITGTHEFRWNDYLEGKDHA